MKVIPVIDVLNGIAVHGIRGERKKYQPIQSVLTKSADPTEVAAAFESHGFTCLYLADLDAILNKSPNFGIYTQISKETDLKLMVDAGITDISLAKQVLDAGVNQIVVGSETLTSIDFVKQAVTAFGENKIVVSIDQKQGKLLSTSEKIASLDTVTFVKQLTTAGVHQVILLDLDRVGTEHGINSGALQNILDQTGVDVLVGGGIRSLAELEQLKTLGASGALVATVLHNGKLSVESLRDAGLL